MLNSAKHYQRQKPMLAKLIATLSIATFAVTSQAATRYNFWFQISDGYTQGAYVLWDADASTIVGGGGTSYSPNKSEFTSTLTNFAGTSLKNFTFQLASTGSLNYTVDFSGLEFPSGNYVKYRTTTTTLYEFVGAISPEGVSYGEIAPGAVGGIQVPEIDGTKLPQVLLLLGGLLVAYRSRKMFKVPQNIAVQAI